METRFFTHPEGLHLSVPWVLPRLYWKKQRLEIEFQLHPLFSNYTLPAGDQGDWNKLIGLDFSPLTPGNVGLAVMLAWRSYEGRYEAGLYAHDAESGRSAPESNGTLFQAGTWHNRVALNWEPGFWLLETSRGVKKVAGPTTLPRLSRLIRPWFGGNRPAPSAVSFDLAWQ